jgi:hypothetical protein
MAADKGIPVMLESWIHETWEANQKKYISALDEPLCSLKCPAFTGLNITITQFPKNRKDKIKAIIENNGLIFVSLLWEEFSSFYSFRWKILSRND